MTYFKGIKTSVLLTILAAQASWCGQGRALTTGELADCHNMITSLQQEISSRGESIQLLDKPLFDILGNLKPFPFHVSIVPDKISSGAVVSHDGIKNAMTILNTPLSFVAN